MIPWQPTATRATLERRAAMFAQIRSFFASRGVLEVDTAMVINSPVTDVHIHSAEVHFVDGPRKYYLHTSAEYAMKRLLAAGSGDIFQICHVVRSLERGRHHNAEFTMIEWYRLGLSLEQLMEEVATLVQQVLPSAPGVQLLTYEQAFRNELDIDPLTAPIADLQRKAADLGFTSNAATRDELLDMLMGTHVGPRLGHDALTFIHRYPASQAVLAQIDAADPRVALRFELYYRGVELANGFKELTSGREQRARFEQDQAIRRAQGLPDVQIDELLLAALDAGLPDCSGVALGAERLLMLATGAQHIDEVLPFPIERA